MEVVSFFQIALAELVGNDLDIIPGTFIGELELTEETKLNADPMPDNALYRWKFVVPRTVPPGTAGLEQFQGEMLECLVRIVRDLSVMPDNQFVEVFKKEIVPHLFWHDFIARRFPELMDFFAGEYKFGIIGRTDFACPFAKMEWSSEPHKLLGWVDTLHPRYVEGEEKERVKRRYERCMKGLRFSLPRFLKESAFSGVIREVRNNGWKDWHILVAMLGAVANYRTRLRVVPGADIREYMDVMEKEMFYPEEEEKPIVPMSELSFQNLELNLMMSLSSTLSNEGLVLRNGFPSTSNLFEYARRRWRYFDLDIEHEQIFPDC